MKKKNILKLFVITLGVIMLFAFNKANASEITSIFTGETLTRNNLQTITEIGTVFSNSQIVPITLGIEESKYKTNDGYHYWAIKESNGTYKDIYCLNLNRGFGAANHGAITESTEPKLYREQFDFNSISNEQYINFTGLSTENKNKILWILNNSATSQERLSAILNAASSKVETAGWTSYVKEDMMKNDDERTELTFDDIKIIQQTAIWHYTNPGSIFDNKINAICDVNGKQISSQGENILVDTPSYEDYVRSGLIKQAKISALYKYFIDGAESGNTQTVIPTLNLSNENVTVTEIEGNYIVGPFELEGENISLIKELTANVSKEYKLLDFSKKEVSGNDFNKVIRNNFYLKISKNDINEDTQIKIDLTYKYDIKKLTFITDTSDLTNTQPLVIVDSEEKDPTITIDATIELKQVVVEKVWADNNNQDNKRPTSVKVQLYERVGNNETSMGDEYKVVLNKENNWTYTWDKLLNNEYIVKEINSSNKAVQNNAKLDDNYTVTYTVEGNKTTITNTHIPETTAVSGTKTWEDNNNQDGKRPESITVNLLVNGTKLNTKTVTAPWTYSFTNLDKYKDGKEIVYTITEEEVENYTTTIKEYNITNKYVPETIEKTVLKVWDDGNNQDSVRPTSVKITLYKTVNQEKQEVKNVTLNAENNWTYTWADLPKYENGIEIKYTVSEEVVDKYTPSYSEDTFTITNTYTPDKTSKKVIKQWEDNNNQDGKRPDNVKVQLKADGQAFSEIIELNNENGFEYTWTELPLKKDGKEIVYSVEEVEVPEGYTVEYSAEDYSDEDTITITNAYTPETINKTVIKKWEDNNNQDEIRPGSIEVQLYKKIENTETSMGEKGKVVLNEENDWTYTWEGLPAKEEGKTIVYRVEEVEVPEGYTEAYSSESYSDTDTITITNAYIPKTINKTVIKQWEDNNNQDKIRPESIDVQLYKQIEEQETSMGEEYKVVLNEENNWKHTWEGLPAKEEGKEIVYSVKEVEVPEGYTVKYSSEDYSDTDTITITNTHIPKIFDLSLRKFITKVNDTQYSREPIVDTSKLRTVVNGKTITTATYKHIKTPIAVQKGDIVTYTIRVYNEGEVDGYVDMITDHLPDNLLPIIDGIEGIDSKKYEKEVEFNLDWGWVFTDEGNTVSTTKTSKVNSETYSMIPGYEDVTDTKLDAYVEGNDRLDYIDVQIKCLVTENAVSGEYLTNIAEITDAQDINGIHSDGIDSNVANVDISNLSNYKNEEAIGSTIDSYVEGQEDDDDFEKLVVKEFDLSLRKFITKVNETSYLRQPVVDTSKLGTVVNGKTITTATYTHTKEPVIVETNDLVTYTIRIYNEGTLDGFANEIADNIPEGLEFLPNSDINVAYKWKMIDSEGNITEDASKAVIIVTDYLSNSNVNNIINAVSEKEGVKTLNYKDVQVQFKVIAKPENLKDNVIINEAQISSDSDIDIDSIPNKNEKYDYTTGNNEDDIDYEPIKLKYFDLALRKFITKVNDIDYNNRYPEIIYNEDGSIKYNHTKDPVLVTTNDIVIYTIRVYNEGERTGYATEIIDNLPEGLEFMPDNEINKQYGWKLIDSDGNITEELEKAVKAKTDYLKTESIDAFVEKDGQKILSYKDVKIAFTVTEPNTSDRILVNTAEISNDSDDDIDSIPGNDILTEDDIDREYVKVKCFDLSLKKWVTKTIVTYNGKTTTTQTGYKEDSDKIAKVDLVADKMNKTTVKFAYNIKVTNEGEIPGYAYEVKDYIPKGLKFVAEDNKEWKELEDGSVVTEKLKDVILNPGESATVEIILTWKNSTTNLGLKTNYAEISKDSADDIDSTPDNFDKKEDDIDDAQAILSIKTAGATTYIGLVFAVVTILAGGIFLIRKYVIK